MVRVDNGSTDFGLEDAMQIELLDAKHANEARLSQAFADRVRRALDRMAPNIRRVIARFRDENGPKGGVDQSLTLEVALRDGRILRATARAAEIMAAVDCALGKIARRLSDLRKREIDRRRAAKPVLA
jgi:ribosome-associated translation inhibitor RaiA